MIQTLQLAKTYRQGRRTVPVLRSVDLTVARGQGVLLTGASGSGKTTLLSVLGCLTRPTAGEVWLEGQEVGRLAGHFRSRLRREKIGFVFQQFQLLPHRTALENITLPLAPTGLSRRARERKAEELAERFNLTERLHFPTRFLSGGEQQRVSLARALIHDPAVILADEPNSNVSEADTRQLMDCLAAQKQAGTTILIASHDPVWRTSSLVDAVYAVQEGVLTEERA